MKRPGNQQRAHGGFGTGGVLAAKLIEPEQLLHFFKHQLTLPASTIE
jgi:hypothetical protein